MSRPTVQLLISYGQSFSVGAEGRDAISIDPIYPNHALMFDYVNEKKRNADWGAIGPNSGVFDPLDVAGFAPLKNFSGESHTASMINTVLRTIQDANRELPTILNLSSGMSGRSIGDLSDRSDTPYQNLIAQVEAAVFFASENGFDVSPDIWMYWKQGSANSNIFHRDYAAALSDLHDQISLDLSGVISDRVSVDMFIDIGGRRGSAWGNLDYVLINDNAHLVAERQFDHDMPFDGIDIKGFWGGHRSNTAYYMQGVEAGYKIADVFLNSEILADVIQIDDAELVSGREIIISFAGLRGGLVVDEHHASYFENNNSRDLGFFAYTDAGKYTGAHPFENRVASAEIFSENQVKIYMERDVTEAFYLGIGGGDGSVELKGTPLRDSVTRLAPNLFSNSEIDTFNAFGGIKKFVPYHFVKIGAEGLIYDASEIAKGAELGGLPTDIGLTIDGRMFDVIDHLAANQGVGTHTLDPDGRGLTVADNAWKAVSGSFTITSATVLSFTFEADVLGEIHGIGFANGDRNNAGTVFQLAGTQAWGLQDAAWTYTPGTGPADITIDVGRYFTGTFDRFVFVMDDDEWVGADSSFRDISLGVPVNATPVSTLTIDGRMFDVIDHLAANQGVGTHTLDPDGRGLTVADNAWKAVSGSFTITSATVLSFTFEADVLGEIHGIGFANGDRNNAGTVFQLAGTQAWGLQDAAWTYTPGTGPADITIDVGRYFTGTFDRFVFVMDDDEWVGADSSFRDISLGVPTGQQPTDSHGLTDLSDLLADAMPDLVPEWDYAGFL